MSRKAYKIAEDLAAHLQEILEKDGYYVRGCQSCEGLHVERVQDDELGTWSYDSDHDSLGLIQTRKH